MLVDRLPVTMETATTALVAATLAAALAVPAPASAQPAPDCADAVQGEVAWNYEGDTRWASSNVARLCRGAKDSPEPARCFERVMHGGVSWGGGTRWQWENALALCRGTRDADATVRCFNRRIDADVGWREAIEACRWDAAGDDDTGGPTPPIPLPDSLPLPLPRQEDDVEASGAEAIAAKYRALGGRSGRLGAPDAPVRTNPDETGMRRRYANGHIYWHPETGAHPIYDGPIWEQWADQRWEEGELGYPVSDPRSVREGHGSMQRFEGGFLHSAEGGADLLLSDRGYVGCRDDDPACNVCASGVEEQFERLAIRPGTNRRAPSGRFRIHRRKGDELPPRPLDRMPNVKFAGGQHVQGFSRIDVDDHRWFVLTNGSNRKDAGFAVVHLGRSVPNRGGERIVRADQDRDAYKVRRPKDMMVRYYYPVGGPDGERRFSTDHPGGVQVVGSLVFVPYKAGGRGRVDVWDLSDPASGRFVQTVPLPDWCEGEVAGCDSGRYGALYVAVARMDDGRYMMLVNRGDGGQSTLLASDAEEVTPSTRWEAVANLRLRGDYYTDRSAYQNANFVTDCDTGRLYLVAMRQERNLWDSDNVAELFRVNVGGGGPGFDLSRVNRIEPDGSDGDWCDLRGGGGMYVTPSNEMVLYCSQGIDKRGNGNHLKFSEHTVN